MSLDYIHQEIIIMLRAVMLGAFAGLCYDVIRILRRVRTRGKVSVWFEDILFWSAASVIMFFFLMKWNYGTVRIYIFAGFFAGMVIFEVGPGKIFVKTMSWTLKKADCVLKKMLKPFRMILMDEQKRGVGFEQNKKSKEKESN